MISYCPFAALFQSPPANAILANVHQEKTIQLYLPKQSHLGQTCACWETDLTDLHGQRPALKPGASSPQVPGATEGTKPLPQRNNRSRPLRCRQGLPPDHR